MNAIPERVEATLWGKGRSLFSLLLRRDILYNLDIAELNGDIRITLDKNNVRMLRRSNIEIVNIANPKEIDLVISKLNDKMVPIIFQGVVKPMPGYTRVNDILLEPDSVIVEGPQAEIDSIASVLTEYKNYQNIKRNFAKTIRLIKPKQEHVTLNFDETKLSANIQKLLEKRIVEIPVKVINPPENAIVTIVPSTLSLILEGGAELLLNVTQKDVTAYLDYSKIMGSKEKNHPAYINTPRGTRYRDAKPMRFKIVVERKHVQNENQ
jgi:YbbR domain-containing protein